MIGVCMECDEHFELDDDADVGDTVECPRCKTRYEILDLDPVIFDYADE